MLGQEAGQQHWLDRESGEGDTIERVELRQVSPPAWVAELGAVAQGWVEREQATEKDQLPL